MFDRMTTTTSTNGDMSLSYNHNDCNDTLNDSISAHDVLLGRGGKTNAHVGNREYRRIVFEHQAEYLKARKKEKVVIAKRVVAQVKQNGGRFLKKDHTDCWVEVPDKRAVEKTSQALREGLDVRNQTIRPNKIYRDDTDSVDKKKRKTRIIAGKVVHCQDSPTSASSVVSVDQDVHSLPDLNDEFTHGAAFLHYQPDLNKMDEFCEV